MKKLVLMFFLFIGCPVFAANTLQQQAEKDLNNLYKNKFSEEQRIALLNYMLLRDDYLASTDNTADTIYNRIITVINNNCNSKQKECLIRCQYSKEIQNRVYFLGEAQNSVKQIITDFNKRYKQIIINDNDYQYLKGTYTIFAIWIVNSVHNFPVERF